MSLNNVKSFLFSKLFFPKVVTINEPGLVYNRVSTRLSTKETKKRIIFFFEEIIIALQSSLFKEIGKEKAEILFYKSSKEFFTWYFVHSSPKKVSQNNINVVLKYFLSVFESTGFSCCANFSYDSKTQEIVVWGENNLFSSDDNIAGTTEGTLAGIASFVLGKECQAETVYINGSGECKFRAGPGIIKYSGLKYDTYTLARKDYFGNQKKDLTSSGSRNTFADYIKFKKVIINEHDRLLLVGKTIFPIPQMCIDILHSNFISIGKEMIYSHTIISTSQRIMDDFKKRGEFVKLIDLENLIAVLGWGLAKIFVNHAKHENSVKIYLTNIPSSNHTFFSEILVINGFINSLTGKKYLIDSVNQKLESGVLSLDILFKLSKNYC